MAVHTHTHTQSMGMDATGTEEAELIGLESDRFGFEDNGR